MDLCVIFEFRFRETEQFRFRENEPLAKIMIPSMGHLHLLW